MKMERWGEDWTRDVNVGSISVEVLLDVTGGECESRRGPTIEPGTC